MLYASLKAIHLLSIVVWVGGMFFVLACLRPASAILAPAARVALMHAALRRFFAAVAIAALLALLSGAAMLETARSVAVRSGLAFNMPLDWYAMIALFVVMAAIFAHVRLVLFRRLGVAVATERWADGAAALATIRIEVLLNLVLGVFIIVFVRLGGVA
ncbi:MAG: CopD family protein [Caldimonas sp.]